MVIRYIAYIMFRLLIRKVANLNPNIHLSFAALMLFVPRVAELSTTCSLPY